MNNVKKIALVLLVSVMSLAANAQLKIAHIDANDVYYKMPEFKIAGMRTDSLKSIYEKEIEALKIQLGKMEAEITALPANTSDIVKQNKYAAYQDAQKRAQEFVQNADEDIQTQDAKFKEPVLKKLKATIETVAKEKGYAYVFDDQALLVKPTADDITAAVLAKLGINEPAPTPVPTPKK